MWLKSRIERSSHVFGHNQGTSIYFEVLYCAIWFNRVWIDVESYHVRVLQLVVIKFYIVYTPVPYSRRDRLRRIRLSCPRESSLKKRHWGWKVIRISWLIIDVPHNYSGVIFELTDYILEVYLVYRKHCLIGVLISSRWLYPSWIVNTWNRCWLRPKEALGIPAVIKHDE